MGGGEVEGEMRTDTLVSGSLGVEEAGDGVYKLRVIGCSDHPPLPTPTPTTNHVKAPSQSYKNSIFPQTISF